MQSPMLDVYSILHLCLGRLSTRCDHLCSLRSHCLYYRNLAFGSPVAFRRNDIIGLCLSRHALESFVFKRLDRLDQLSSQSIEMHDRNIIIYIRGQS